MRKGKPSQLMEELSRKIDELKDNGVTSAEVIDDGEEVIEADESAWMEDVDVSVPDDEAGEVAEEVLEDEATQAIEDFEPSANNDYLTYLYQNVEEALDDLVSGVSWSSDDANVYMDVNFETGNVITFTIPKADLVFDMNSMKTDVNYICDAVRQSHSEEEPFAEEDIPEAPAELPNDYFDEDLGDVTV